MPSEKGKRKWKETRGETRTKNPLQPDQKLFLRSISAERDTRYASKKLNVVGSCNQPRKYKTKYFNELLVFQIRQNYSQITIRSVHLFLFFSFGKILDAS